MSDSLTALYLSNPQLAAALRRQQYAMPLLQQGTSAEPIQSPWQGMSRVAQALMGAYMMRKSDRDITDLGAKQQAALADALEGAKAPLPSQMLQQPAASPDQPAQPMQQPMQAPGLAPAVHQMESGGSMQPGIMGDGGAASGPMQVHQAALTDVNRAQGTNYTLDQLNSDPGLGKRVGDQYLALQQQRFPGRPDLALAAYNAGPTATANAGGPGVPGVPPAAAGYVAKGLQLAQAGPGAPPAAAAPQTGMRSPMIADAMEMMRRANAIELAAPYDPRAKLQAGALRQQAQMMMTLDVWKTNPDGTQVNQRTTEVKNAAQPRPNWEASIDPQTGVAGYRERNTGEFKQAVTGMARLTLDAAGNLWDSPAGGAPPRIVSPADTGGIALRKMAETQGGKTGEAAAATVGKMASLGQEADTAIGNIDYGLNQLNQARQGGINSGFFAPWLASAAAAGKSLGVDLGTLGIDPKAVGNVQSAQKTLGVVSGTILQNTIGKDSAITDAKIEHFIHTQPGIETDPDAIQRVLGWARSQFVFNRGMAMHAMKSTDQAGMLPPGWQARFYQEKGAFAPIYDPLSQEMRQPQGEGPAAEPPAKASAPQAQSAIPPEAAAALREGKITQFGNGQRWTLRGGQPQQVQ